MKHSSRINQPLADSPKRRVGSRSAAGGDLKTGASKTPISFVWLLCVLSAVGFALTVGVRLRPPATQAGQQVRPEPVALFEPNLGQGEPRADFLVSHTGYSAGLSAALYPSYDLTLTLSFSKTCSLPKWYSARDLFPVGVSIPVRG